MCRFGFGWWADKMRADSANWHTGHVARFSTKDTGPLANNSHRSRESVNAKRFIYTVVYCSPLQKGSKEKEKEKTRL